MADAVPESILKTIRKMIGPAEDYEYFDTDLIININSAFSRLCQLGVGPTRPFKITGEDEVWTDFIDDGYQEEVKQYVYLKTKLIFDPPANGGVVNLYQQEIEKLEWLLKEVARDDY
jgi:hypothetical protein